LFRDNSAMANPGTACRCSLICNYLAFLKAATDSADFTDLNA
jgi:hypothetical protein